MVVCVPELREGRSIAMPIRQLYYTSCHHPVSGQTGFQVKAATPDIPRSTQELVKKSLGYQIPPDMRDQPIETHPVALRYLPVSAEEAILLCTQSNGPDEMNRPGNYFAHAAIGEPALLTSAYQFPPVAYWGSPFWVLRDDSTQVELAASEAFNAKITFDLTSAWTFLEQGRRRDWFYRLLCALVDYPQTRRKIVILDDAANVAQWVYALSLALPARFRPLMSFSTYHHDPQAASFMVIGALPGSNFRVSTEMHRKFFILDTASGDVGESPPSDYADYVTHYFAAEHFAEDGEIMRFYDWAAGRGDRQGTISRTLDDMANFYLASVRGTAARDWGQVVRGAAFVVDDLHAVETFAKGDVADGRKAVELLDHALLKTRESGVVPVYGRALAVLRKFDENFADTCASIARLFGVFAVGNQASLAGQLHEIMEGLYSREQLAATFNDPELLSALVIHPDDPQQVMLFWQAVAPYLDLAGPEQGALGRFFNATFQAIDAQPAHDRYRVPTTAQRLIDVLFQAIGKRWDVLLSHASQYRRDHTGGLAFEWVYYAVVDRLPLEVQARDYWPRYWEEFPDLCPYELRRDLLRYPDADTDTVLGTVLEWMQVAGLDEWRAQILEAGLGFAWEQPRLDLLRMARYVLAQETLVMHLKDAWYRRLVETTLDGAVVEPLDETTATLYVRLENDRTLDLNDDHMAVIQGALILSDNEPTEVRVERIRARLLKLGPEAYQHEVTQYLHRFFASQRHIDMVAMVYAPQHRTIFWGLYWEQFQIVLLDERRADVIVEIINAWFEMPPVLVNERQFVVQEFFVDILDVLREVRAQKGYKNVGAQFEGLLKQQPWYRVVEKALQKQRRGLLGGWFDR